MEEFKEKENLPEGWKRVKLEEVVKENLKSHLKVEDADNSGVYPFFTSGKNVLTHSKFLVEGENLFVSTGGTAYVKYYKGRASYSADTYSLKTKENTKLIFYILTKAIDQITFRYFIGSGLEHLQKDYFKRSFQFAIPKNPTEQQKIAEILETVDNIIEKTNRIIEKHRKIKQGLMQELLTKGIDENGNIRNEETHQFKDSPVGRIPIEWEVKRLEEVGEIYDNQRIPLDAEDRATIKGDIPYCGATGIIDYIRNYIFYGEYVLIAEDGGKFSRFEQTAYIMKGKFWANNHVHIVKGKNRILDNRFLMYWLNFQDLNYYISGSTREKLNQQLLKSFPVICPPFPEQQKIAEILETVDNIIEKEQKYKEKLEKLKQGFMEDLLTGKVRVNNLIKEDL